MLISFIATLAVIISIFAYIWYANRIESPSRLYNAFHETWEEHFKTPPVTLFFDPNSVYTDTSLEGLFHLAHVVWAENIERDNELLKLNPDDNIRVISPQSRYHDKTDFHLKKFDCVIIASANAANTFDSTDILKLLTPNGIVINICGINLDDLVTLGIPYYQFAPDELK